MFEFQLLSNIGSIKKVTGWKILNKVSLTLYCIPFPIEDLNFKDFHVYAKYVHGRTLNVLKNKNAVIIYLMIIFKQINSHIYFLQLIIKIHAAKELNNLFPAIIYNLFFE